MSRLQPPRPLRRRRERAHRDGQTDQQPRQGIAIAASLPSFVSCRLLGPSHVHGRRHNGAAASGDAFPPACEQCDDAAQGRDRFRETCDEPPLRDSAGLVRPASRRAGEGGRFLAGRSKACPGLRCRMRRSAQGFDRRRSPEPISRATPGAAVRAKLNGANLAGANLSRPISECKPGAGQARRRACWQADASAADFTIANLNGGKMGRAAGARDPRRRKNQRGGAYRRTHGRASLKGADLSLPNLIQVSLRRDTRRRPQHFRPDRRGATRRQPQGREPLGG